MNTVASEISNIRHVIEQIAVEASDCMSKCVEFQYDLILVLGRQVA